ncbi:MAG: TonB-dependent receptor [Burkholderiaceae bacterium]|nr:TonB-dependent receptor [Burkholderiaceae bacterium]
MPHHRSPRWMRWLFACATACTGPVAVGQTTPRGTEGTLATIVITSRTDANGIGSSDAASQGVIDAESLAQRPTLRPGEVLEFIPGMVVTQHSGDGKANQYFLRGFNLDHGTDFATSLNGMPINMSTHAHGQGYTDMNVLIPELVDRIEYQKGPYFATHGDFSSAGAADIFYKNRLSGPLVQVSAGPHGYQRGLAANTATLNENFTLWGAVEWMGNNGPWVEPERLQRKNAVLQLVQGNAGDGSTISLMAYNGRWNATDQIPQRLIDAGSYNGKPFGRFDTLDPTSGGKTSRYSLSGEWHRRDKESETHVSVYAIQYDLQLFSNFTYAMDRPETGDQIAQKDDRSIFGMKASQAWNHHLAGIEMRSEVGTQLRHDRIHLGLYDTQARHILGTTRIDDVHQTLLGLYAQSHVQWTPWLRSVLGLRSDAANFTVNSVTRAANSGASQARLWSPKMAWVAGPWQATEFFFNAGKGFHSNDARGTTAKLDPRTGTSIDAVPGLVASRGWELGVRSQAIANVQSTLTYWRLRFDSELVYAGEVGATEASVASRRHGLEWNNHWSPNRHLAFDANLALTRARFVNGERIPNAVDSVASLAATLKGVGPWSVGLQWRYLGSSPLTEDNAVRSPAASIFNLRLTRDLHPWLGRQSDVTLDVFNLTNRRVNDIQYYYASQLPSEARPINDRAMHPAEPRSVRITLRSTF